MAAGPEHAPQLVAPGELELVRQVCEDGERIDEVELVVVGVEPGCEPVVQERCEAEVLPAPVDRFQADVAAGDGAGEAGPVAGDAAAAAAEVEDRLVALHGDVRDDRVVGGPAAAEEPFGVGGAGDADHQTAWGEGRTAVGR